MADLQESNTSCPICLNLHKPAWTLEDFEPARDERDDLHHYFSPNEVVESTEKGCRGCLLITRIFPYDLSDPAIQAGCLTIERPDMNVLIAIYHVQHEESYEDPSIEAFDWTDTRELLTTIKSSRKVDKVSGGSRDVIALDATTKLLQPSPAQNRCVLT